MLRQLSAPPPERAAAAAARQGIQANLQGPQRVRTLAPRTPSPPPKAQAPASAAATAQIDAAAATMRTGARPTATAAAAVAASAAPAGANGGSGASDSSSSRKRQQQQQEHHERPNKKLLEAHRAYKPCGLYQSVWNHVAEQDTVFAQHLERHPGKYKLAIHAEPLFHVDMNQPS